MNKKKKTVPVQAPVSPLVHARDSLEQLQDTRNPGKSQAWNFLEPFEAHSQFSERLSRAYADLSARDDVGDSELPFSPAVFEKRSSSTLSCGSFLRFAHGFQPSTRELSTESVLTGANFCKDRFCPMCNWRRSLKLFSYVIQMTDVLQADYLFLFLTLTVPNVSASDLPVTIDQMNKAYTRFLRLKALSFIKGTVRVLEITRNAESGEYHPHFHCLVAVPRSYFFTFYLKQSAWADAWTTAYQSHKPLIVDVRKVKQSAGSPEGESGGCPGSAVAEVVKYAVKPSDYLDAAITPEGRAVILSELFPALWNRRLFNTTGVFRETFQKLRLSDPETASLSDDDLEIFSRYPYLLEQSFSRFSGEYDLVSSSLVKNPAFSDSRKEVS